MTETTHAQHSLVRLLQGEHQLREGGRENADGGEREKGVAGREDMRTGSSRINNGLPTGEAWKHGLNDEDGIGCERCAAVRNIYLSTRVHIVSYVKSKQRAHGRFSSQRARINNRLQMSTTKKVPLAACHSTTIGHTAQDLDRVRWVPRHHDAMITVSGSIRHSNPMDPSGKGSPGSLIPGSGG